MTPLSHTMYSLTLFLALVALSQWSHRRQGRLSKALPAD